MDAQTRTLDSINGQWALAEYEATHRSPGSEDAWQALTNAGITFWPGPDIYRPGGRRLHVTGQVGEQYLVVATVWEYDTPENIAASMIGPCDACGRLGALADDGLVECDHCDE